MVTKQKWGSPPASTPLSYPFAIPWFLPYLWSTGCVLKDGISGVTTLLTKVAVWPDTRGNWTQDLSGEKSALYHWAILTTHHWSYSQQKIFFFSDFDWIHSLLFRLICPQNCAKKMLTFLCKILWIFSIGVNQLWAFAFKIIFSHFLAIPIKWQQHGQIAHVLKAFLPTATVRWHLIFSVTSHATDFPWPGWGEKLITYILAE